MNYPLSRRNVPVITPVERRISIAMRTPQMVTTRSLLFIVGTFCAVFGILAIWHAQLNASPEDLARPFAVATGLVTDGGKALTFQDTRSLHGIIATFGLITMLLTTHVYRFPLIVPIIVSLLFAGTFVAFLILHHSDLAVLYVLASFGILAVMIKSLVSGVQFFQSFARMGRPDDN